jgi:hypothetical protein
MKYSLSLAAKASEFCHIKIPLRAIYLLFEVTSFEKQCVGKHLCWSCGIGRVSSLPPLFWYIASRNNRISSYRIWETCRVTNTYATYIEMLHYVLTPEDPTSCWGVREWRKRSHINKHWAREEDVIGLILQVPQLLKGSQKKQNRQGEGDIVLHGRT